MDEADQCGRFYMYWWQRIKSSVFGECERQRWRALFRFIVSDPLGEGAIAGNVDNDGIDSGVGRFGSFYGVWLGLHCWFGAWHWDSRILSSWVEWQKIDICSWNYNKSIELDKSFLKHCSSPCYDKYTQIHDTMSMICWISKECVKLSSDYDSLLIIISLSLSSHTLSLYIIPADRYSVDCRMHPESVICRHQQYQQHHIKQHNKLTNSLANRWFFWVNATRSVSNWWWWWCCCWPTLIPQPFNSCC